MDINALNKIKTHYNFNPSNILDIGANDGYFANLCSTIWPTSNLTLVEANPFWSDILKEKNYKNIITLLGNEKKQSVKGPGLYCFTEVQNKLTSCSTFLYVGRTQTLNKRFNEHRRAWLNKYVLANPKYHLHWGYICAENLSNDFGSVQQVETWCWRNKEKLGLSLGTKLIGTDYESD